MVYKTKRRFSHLSVSILPAKRAIEIPIVSSGRTLFETLLKEKKLDGFAIPGQDFESSELTYLKYKVYYDNASDLFWLGVDYNFRYYKLTGHLADV